MSGKKRILYVQASGVEAPERCYAPFILATAASAMGLDAAVYFIVRGVALMKKGEAEKIRLGDFPSLREVIDQAVEAGVKLEVCEQSCMLFGLGKETIMDAAKIVGATTLNDRVLDADAVLSF